MFGKLKDKLKSWIKNSKEEITKVENTKKEKKKEKPKKERKPEISKKDEVEILSKKSPKKVKEVLEEKPGETAEDVSKRLEEVKEEAIDKELKEKAKEIKEEVPKKFNAGRKKYEADLDAIQEREKELEQEIEEQEKKKTEKKGFFSRVKSKFSYKITREEFDKIFEDLEMLLLENNVALEVVEDIESKLSEKLIDKEINQEDLEEEIKSELKSALNEILIDPDDPLEIIKLKSKEEGPFVILFFGINGTGKTTSIAKLTNLLKKNNLTVALAAADTFRAASIEQIQIHADKLKVPLIKHDYGVDPSAVGFDAIKYAKKHKIDVVLIDTAGRMHTKTNLLAEMEKIVRVTNPDLKIFVAESIAGNDATEQAKSFHEMIEIDGAILSKADIDDKGGTIISVSHTTHKPIFYLGTGQEYDDLKLFDKQKFIEDLGL
jgi:fused signal recognition particle receptor